MTTDFVQTVTQIAAEFATARIEPLKDHPLAQVIRHWSKSALALADPKFQAKLTFVSSPGAGQWNAAPWLAVLHPTITTSAQLGYYPVYLFVSGQPSHL